MKNISEKGLKPSIAKINWHSRTLAEVFVITLLGLIVFSLSTKLRAVEHSHARHLETGRLDVLIEIQQLMGWSKTNDEMVFEPMDQAVEPREPERTLSPSERKAIEQHIQNSRWTE